jgi:uncharacterized alkaline shock family protein YloU
LNEARSLRERSPKTTSDIKITPKDIAEIRGGKIKDVDGMGFAKKIRENKQAKITRADLTKEISEKRATAMSSHDKISRKRVRSFI